MIQVPDVAALFRQRGMCRDNGLVSMDDGGVGNEEAEHYMHRTSGPGTALAMKRRLCQPRLCRARAAPGPAAGDVHVRGKSQELQTPATACLSAMMDEWVSCSFPGAPEAEKRQILLTRWPQPGAT